MNELKSDAQKEKPRIGLHYFLKCDNGTLSSILIGRSRIAGNPQEAE
jgi:hypothetical protein